MTGQTTVPEVNYYEVSDRFAKQAMAAIGNAQMHTWAKFTNSLSPTDMIAEAIRMALKEAGVQHVDT